MEILKEFFKFTNHEQPFLNMHIQQSLTPIQTSLWSFERGASTFSEFVHPSIETESIFKMKPLIIFYFWIFFLLFIGHEEDNDKKMIWDDDEEKCTMYFMKEEDQRWKMI